MSKGMLWKRKKAKIGQIIFLPILDNDCTICNLFKGQIIEIEKTDGYKQSFYKIKWIEVILDLYHNNQFTYLEKRNFPKIQNSYTEYEFCLTKEAALKSIIESIRNNRRILKYMMGRIKNLINHE